MSNKNPYSVVYLMGGFGNQLFQLCFANNLRKFIRKLWKWSCKFNELLTIIHT